MGIKGKQMSNETLCDRIVYSNKTLPILLGILTILGIVIYQIKN